MADTVASTPWGVLEFSPVRRDDADKENDVPVLSLIQFSKAPFVTFGTVKVGTSKSAVLRILNPTEESEAEVSVEKVPSGRGFSVEPRSFTVQPEGSFSLTVTWTPTEEGGIRELLVFNANGVLKHQAVLLGRAEAPRKRKKSLWDTIKNKRGGERVVAQRGKKTGPPLKMTANKTFQVPREPQYKRDKPRSPLAALNEGRAARERPLATPSPSERRRSVSGEQKAFDGPLCSTSSQENVPHTQRNCPPARVVPTATLTNASASSDAVTAKCEHKVLNRTLSPIGTPERFKKLMPRIQLEAPLFSTVRDTNDEDANSTLIRSSIVSLKDALLLIGSDLSHTNISLSDTSSTCDFSDSLESKSGKPGSDSPERPESSQTSEPTLALFASKKVAESRAVAFEAEKVVKKASFTSATVTKGKAPPEVAGSSERRVKKSRRRLLEKTLELSDSSGQSNSGPGTPSLPVIDSDPGLALSDSRSRALEVPSFSPTPNLVDSPAPVAFPMSSPPRFSFSIASPPLASFSIASPGPVSSSSPLHCKLLSNSPVLRETAAPPVAKEDLFPIQLAANAKKRKSEEYLRTDGKVEVGGTAEQVKRTKRVPGTGAPVRSVQDRRRTSQGQKPAGLVPTASSRQTRRAAPPAQAKRPRSNAAVARGSVKTSKVVAVAQAKLTFVMPTQTALPRHPTPFAAKNMFYDERWIEKQESGFTWWVNYVLTPDDFKVNTEVTKVSAVSLALGGANTLSVPKAPTKEEMSFSTYTARRKLNRLRRSACQLFTSDAVVKAVQRLELEVEARRLLVRKDRHLWKDIGERRKVLDWLLSYNPLWLRIGLETIFGELISLESNSDTLGLAMFILQRLLWNPDIAAEYRHARVPHLYRDGHEEALSRFTLKKLLLLVCFLDRAKECRLIEHDPCLFCVDAEFKASRDLLLAFSRDFLSGEGILPRHLGYLGLPVSHVQKPLDEFDFAVKNLAVDLKCGIRLVRVMELLVQDWSLSAKLRLPAISRLQKVHNVDVALQVLKGKGVDLKDEHGATIDSRDIVDGHREKTLSLLWKIIFTFHVEVILDEDQLRDEIRFLKETLRTTRMLASLRADRGLQPRPVEARAPYQNGSTKICLLMEWVRTVCDFYSLKVENFTVAFSDGRVLCQLIHHYHPGLLPAAAVSGRTTQTVESSQRGRLELDGSASDSDSSNDSLLTDMDGTNGPDVPAPKFKELLENEKNNFRLFNNAVAYLGGVPAMINPADMSNTIPNEKVVMSYLSFLCARLLNLRNETRAARVIQGAWRKYRLKKDLQLYKERNAAVQKIQAAVQRFLQRRAAERQSRAAVLIQSLWRSYAARHRLRLQREARRHRAAALIQAQWRTFSTMRAYQRLRYHAIVVQAQWRMRRAATAYGKLCRAAAVVQKLWRARVLSRRQREQYLCVRTAAVTIQRGYRRWRALKTQEENRAAIVIQAAFKKWKRRKMADKSAAAIKVQAWFRMQACRCRYGDMKRGAVLIQARLRGHMQRRRFHLMKLRHSSAVVIQSAFRGHAVRKRAAQRHSAAVVIQRHFRACAMRDRQRAAFLRLRRAAVTVQAACRGKAARKSLRKQHVAATTIQAAFRKHAAQRRYRCLRAAATAVQRRYRATLLARRMKSEYEAMRKATLTLQAHWRGRTARRRLARWRECATVIQAWYRRHKAQAQYRAQKLAAEAIQHWYRRLAAGRQVRRAHLQRKAACITLQAAFRGAAVRRELRRKHQAATILQASVRMFLCRKKFSLLQSAAIIIQSRYRALLLCRAQQNKFRQLRRAAVTIQSVYRGVAARRRLKRMHGAATAIQAQFRMYRMHVAFLATKCAAVIIQKHYRAKVIRDQQVQTYRAMKRAAVVIQAAYRAHQVRERLARWHRAAAIIQRWFLAVRDRRRFLAVRAAALFCQRRYRAARRARSERLDYLRRRQAAVRLQAAYRGHTARQQLRVRHAAAVTIQSHFRRYQQRSDFVRLRWASSVLQARFRATLEMRAEMHALRVKRNAAAVLQAAFRGMKSRRALQQTSRAASVLQRAYRARCERRRYLAMRASVLAIQRRYRANAETKRQRKKYEDIRRAAVILQAACRGQQVRKEMRRQHGAATVIQSVFRKHREEVKFNVMRLSAIIIQRRYRAAVLQRTLRHRFLQLRRAAVVLQAAYRGMKARRSIQQMHHAATVLQRAYRGRCLRTAYLRIKLATLVIQRRFQSNVATREQRAKYLEMRRAAVILQAACRGQQVRKEMRRQHGAATVIQSVFRKHREEVKFNVMRLSAIIIQSRYRALLLCRAQQNKFRQLRRAAVTIQSVYRGVAARRRLKRMHGAATAIQAQFRMYRMHVAFLATKCAAVIIQKRYRAKVIRDQQVQTYRAMKRAAVVIQAAYRGHQVRKRLARWHRAAAIIQRWFLAVRDRRRFLAVRAAALFCQRRYRAARRARSERLDYLRRRQAAVRLQAAYRGHTARQQLRVRHAAAVTIQSHFRRYQRRSDFVRLRWASSVLQARFRATLEMRAEMHALRVKRNAAAVLQAAFRGMKSRRALQQTSRAASVLQRAYRARCERRRYLAMRASVLAIQRRYRANAETKRQRKKYEDIRRAAVVLQAACRGQQVRKEMRRQHGAATVIQSVFRKHREEVKFNVMRLSAIIIQRRYRAAVLQRTLRHRFLQLRRAAVVLQAAYRGMKARRSIQQMHHAATVLQRAYRGRCDRTAYLRMRLATLVIQRRFQSNVATRAQRAKYLEMRRAAVVLQAACRGQQVRKEMRRQHGAATVIQSVFRKHREEVKFNVMRLSAIIIQRRYRAAVLQRTLRHRFLQLRRAAVLVQAAWRLRRDVGRQHRAARVIQSCWRCWVQRRLHRRKWEAAVTLQRRFRAGRLSRAARRSHACRRRAAITLQRSCRAWLKRREVQDAVRAERRRRFTAAIFHHLSAIKIQRAFRVHRVLEAARRHVHCVVAVQSRVRARQQRRRYLQDRDHVVTAQRAVRRWLLRRHRAASVIQSAVRTFFLRRRQHRLQEAVVKAQALWRGHRSRRLNDTPRKVRLRWRLHQVTAGVREEDKLCNKTSWALEHLLRYKHFSCLLEALKNLEIATRLSPECCERLVESGATATIVNLIRCCNRSVPCMDVITFAIQILLNLSKYHKTISMVFSVENSVETLLDLLQRYREKAGDKVAEKGGSIFTKACFLLALLLQDAGHTREVLKMPKVLERIRSIYQLTVRKKKMDADRTLVKQKVNGSFYVTPRKSRPAPRFSPDWVLTKHKLKDVVDPLRAIHMVVEALSITV